MSKERKTTITKAEYIQLAGLFVLAEPHVKSLYDIVELACKMLDEDPDDSHVSDELWCKGANNLDGILERLEVTVEEGDG